jgi:hypothetical protein
MEEMLKEIFCHDDGAGSYNIISDNLIQRTNAF